MGGVSSLYVSYDLRFRVQAVYDRLSHPESPARHDSSVESPTFMGQSGCLA